MVDALLALFVLTLGVTLVLVFYTRTSTYQPVVTLSQDFMTALAATKLNKLNDMVIGPQGSLVAQGNITHPENSILQQVAEFYYRWTLGCEYCLDLVNTTIYRAVSVEAKYNYLISVNDEYVFFKNATSYEDARTVLPTRKIVHGEFQNEVYGPYMVEVLVWE